MSLFKKFTKLAIIYFAILPLSYLVFYEVFFSQNFIIIDQLLKIYNSWSTDFIQVVFIFNSSMYNCPTDYENVYNQSQKFLQIKNDYRQDSYFCIKRLPESKIFQQNTPYRQFKACLSNQRICHYKNISICIYYRDQCPISDIKFSNENSLEGFEKLDQRFNNLNIFITRENLRLKPLVQLKITNENQKDIKNDKYYYDSNLEQNDKIFQDNFDILQTNLQLKSNQIEHFQQIDSDSKNQLFIFKEEVIDIQNSCLLYVTDLFKLNYVKAGFLIFISVFAQFYKTCIVLFHFAYEHLSPFYKRQFLIIIMCLLSDVFYIYSTFYSRIEYYNYLYFLQSKGCFDSYGEIYSMIQNIDMKKEIIGIFLSSLTLLVVMIIGSIFYLVFIIITKSPKFLKSKFVSKLNQEKQQAQLASQI
ncbi:hypothetical protein ABPG72_004907 [Tetrahymena utriculariae]